MTQQQDFRIGSVVRADFFWNDQPKADGKTRNCVIIGMKGRQAVICPITSLPKEGEAGAHRIDNAAKRKIDQLGDNKDSWIDLKHANIVYLDGPRLKNNPKSSKENPRLFGQLPDGFVSQLRKEAMVIRAVPKKQQIESDWRDEVNRFRGRGAAAQLAETAMNPAGARGDRVRAAAQRMYDRKNPSDRPKLSLGAKRKDMAIGE